MWEREKKNKLEILSVFSLTENGSEARTLVYLYVLCGWNPLQVMKHEHEWVRVWGLIFR